MGGRKTMMRFAIVAALVTSMPILTPIAMAQDAEAIAAMRRANGKIQFAHYPRDALRRGEQGVVGIKVTTDAQGRLRDCAVSKSSGYASLDEAACDLLIEHAAMKPYLSPDGRGVVRHQDGQVVWQLPEGYKPVATPAVLANISGRTDKKICRVQTKTGSLIASQRICLTKAQWQQQYIHAQEETQDMHPHFLPGE
jgi:TonB family protein